MIDSAKKRSNNPQTRDAEATKARILDAAEEEFAKNGLGAARTEAIAQQTGVTKAMIYYYFESKEKLYEAVLERSFNERLQAVQQIAFQQHTPTDALTKIINNLIRGASANPRWTNILMYEAMQNKGQYYNKIGLTSVYGAIQAVLTEGVKTGEFRNLDPMHAAVNIVGMCSFYFCAHENLKHLWPGKKMLSEEMVQQHLNEAVAMILSGVSNR
jgi:TetR/AcrR family transcriptional regulator